MMNIDGIGEEFQPICSRRVWSRTADLYIPHSEQLTTLERLGHKSALNILHSIDESRKVPFERVIYALSIPYVSETIAKKKIARSVRDIDRLMSMPAGEARLDRECRAAHRRQHSGILCRRGQPFDRRAAASGRSDHVGI